MIWHGIRICIFAPVPKTLNDHILIHRSGNSFIVITVSKLLPLIRLTKIILQGHGKMFGDIPYSALAGGPEGGGVRGAAALDGRVQTAAKWAPVCYK
jgi:hypothetical protein